jgi:hypothetical protein
MTGTTDRLARRRRGLLRQLMADANLHAGQAVPPGFLHPLAVAHTAIAAVDAGLTEPKGKFR